MFILSKVKMEAKEIKEYFIRGEYSDEDYKEAKEIHRHRMNHAYNIGSTAKAKELADEDVERFLKERTKVWRLFVNDSYFCEIESQEKANKLNDSLYEAITNNHSINVDRFLAIK